MFEVRRVWMLVEQPLSITYHSELSCGVRLREASATLRWTRPDKCQVLRCVSCGVSGIATHERVRWVFAHVRRAM